MNWIPRYSETRLWLPDPHEVINLTGNVVKIIDGDGREVLRYNAATEKAFVQRLDEKKAPWPKVDYEEVVGLPDAVEGTYYLVSREVAEVAWRQGRGTHDLLVSMNPCLMGDKPIGYREIHFAKKWLFSFL